MGREPGGGRTSWRSMVGDSMGGWGEEQGGNSEREGCSREWGTPWAPRALQVECWGEQAGKGMGQKAGVSAFLSSGSSSSTLLLCMITSNED